MEYDFLVYACAFSFVFDQHVRIGLELLRHFGSFEAVFKIQKSDWSAILTGHDEIIESIFDPTLLERAQKEVDYDISHGIEILTIFDKKYPARFKECEDASPVLFYKGISNLNEERILAVVGTRRSTYYGKNATGSILKHLSGLNPKPLIISGLAYGIDEYAHTYSLEYGLETIAVIPSNIPRIYPSGHRALAEKIEKRGGVLSDRPSTRTFPAVEPWCFHRRNRIIAGISDATLLVESFAKGGGLITTSFASSYDRDVFAVPGRIGDQSFMGCNDLIYRNKASIVVDGRTIPEAMNWDSPEAGTVKQLSLFDGTEDPLKKNILKKLSEYDVLTINELSVKTGITISKLSIALLEMEIDGTVGRMDTDRYILNRTI